MKTNNDENRSWKYKIYNSCLIQKVVVRWFVMIRIIDFVMKHLKDGIVGFEIQNWFNFSWSPYSSVWYALQIQVLDSSSIQQSAIISLKLMWVVTTNDLNPDIFSFNSSFYMYLHRELPLLKHVLFILYVRWGEVGRSRVDLFLLW